MSLPHDLVLQTPIVSPLQVRSLLFPIPLQSPSPFASLHRPSVAAPDDPPVVSGPFAPHPTVPVSSSAGDVSSTPQSGFAPRLPLDRYVNIVTAMIKDGRFSHIGHGVLRLEGQTDWRINLWDSARWSPVPRGEPRIDLPWLRLRQLLLPLSRLNTCHNGLPSLRLTGW